VLPMLARLNPGDITIRHHYTGDRVRLHSFNHKGYWFHGKKRERATMLAFAKLVEPGSTVFEVGGHIGYISLYFAALVENSGSVVVFEPGPNNLPYIRRNILPKTHVALEPVGVGNRRGWLPLYVEGLTGQNNSFIADFEELRKNERRAHVEAQRATVDVEVITIDEFARGRRLRPDFIKIDVEGFEHEVLQGMASTLREHRPRLMVEIQAHESEILHMLAGCGYVPYDPHGTPLSTADQLRSNTFFVHASDKAGHTAMLQVGASGRSN
jgi:FkbM family methyltransferase